MPEIPTVFFDSFGFGCFGSSWRFGGYVKTLLATHAGEVAEVLSQVEQASANGLYAAGFVAYEAASAINPDLPSAPPVNGLPLLMKKLLVAAIPFKKLLIKRNKRTLKTP